jgi:hypothetical protein
VLEGAFSEKRGANEPETLFIMVGIGGRHLDDCFCRIGVSSVSIPFARKWLKSSVEGFSDVGAKGKGRSRLDDSGPVDGFGG